MKEIKRSLMAGVFLLSLTTDAFSLGSGGIANEVTSPEHLSSLLAVSGSKTDPTIAYNNPASIGDLGRYNTTLGMTYYKTSASRSGNGTSDSAESKSLFAPNFAFGHSFGKIGVGLAVVSPYGLETEWSPTSNVRYVATKSSLKMLDITPAISYRHSEKFAVGFGVDYFTTFDTSLEKKVNVDALNVSLGGSATGAQDANSKMSGDGDQWGYHAGLLFNPTQSHTIGLAYHSEVKTEIEGDIELQNLSGQSALVFGQNFKTAAKTDLFYPQHVQMGYKYSREERWELGVSLAWFDWSSNKQLGFTTPNANATQKLVLQVPVPLNWRDVWSFAIGGNYRFSEKWKLNGGIYYLPAVYPESTFTPAVPDMNKYGFAIGPSYTFGNWAIDGVYNPLFYESRRVANRLGQNATGQTAFNIDGKYEAMIHIVGVNVRYRYQ